MGKILVTGGAGFIGSHLCQSLVKDNKIICLDNLSSGRKKNISHLENEPNFEFLEADVTEHIGLENISQIYHLASLASPKDYLEEPVKTALANSIGTDNLIKLALKNNAKFLFCSTSEAYGEPLVHPQTESYWGNVNPTGIRSCYNESKRFGEALVMAYVRKHRLKGKIVRIFNTYGPRMRKHDGRVMPAFITQALDNKDITVFGNGAQTRSFCYVSDIISGLDKMMDSDKTGPKNLGNDSEISILKLARLIIRLTSSDSKIVFNSLPEDDPSKRQPDVSSAREMLGWEPKVKLEEGLAKTIDWFRNNN
ncbi:MAG: UDP-glucuronic acid decarboxylase family protein [Nanoarchaeota archaeon]